MARYIDADKIKYESYPLDGGYVDTVFVTKEEIDRQPTADVVEVVRCKDCKHHNELRKTCEHTQWEDAEGWDRDVKLNDFCSYGERKEVECLKI